MPDAGMSRAAALAWQERRNQQGGTVDWRFTAEDARIKLKRLYPPNHE